MRESAPTLQERSELADQAATLLRVTRNLSRIDYTPDVIKLVEGIANRMIAEAGNGEWL